MSDSKHQTAYTYCYACQEMVLACKHRCSDMLDTSDPELIAVHLREIEQAYAEGSISHEERVKRRNAALRGAQYPGANDNETYY